jgi:LacI family transcriptional regulator
MRNTFSLEAPPQRVPTFRVLDSNLEPPAESSSARAPAVLALPRTKSAPSILVLLNTNAAWARGIVRGLNDAASERGWSLVVHDPLDDVERLIATWAPAAILVGSDPPVWALSERDRGKVVSLGVDRSADRIASVCVDERTVGQLAAEHLLATGLRNVAVFRRNDQEFALARERAFTGHLARRKVHVAEGLFPPGTVVNCCEDDYAPVAAWLQRLPKPCGVFACSDFWAKKVALCARAVGLRIPEDLAILGVDNDTLQCEAVVPQLSSVVVPWRELGEKAAEFVAAILTGKPPTPLRVAVQPLGVKARRSSEVLAVDDELVARAVQFIRQHVGDRFNLDALATAVGCGRQRLERRFRRSLDRTIQDEIRRTRVDVARRLLETTSGDLKAVAKGSGFANATLLNLAFKRELNMAPGAYRRRAVEAAGDSAD